MTNSEELQTARNLIWQHEMEELSKVVAREVARIEKDILKYIRRHQSECFGGWGWVALPESVSRSTVKSMIERGILLEGRTSYVVGIAGEVEDSGSQTGSVIILNEKPKRKHKSKHRPQSSAPSAPQPPLPSRAH